MKLSKLEMSNTQQTDENMSIKAIWKKNFSACISNANNKDCILTLWQPGEGNNKESITLPAKIQAQLIK